MTLAFASPRLVENQETQELVRELSSKGPGCGCSQRPSTFPLSRSLVEIVSRTREWFFPWAGCLSSSSPTLPVSVDSCLFVRPLAIILSASPFCTLCLACGVLRLLLLLPGRWTTAAATPSLTLESTPTSSCWVGAQFSAGRWQFHTTLGGSFPLLGSGIPLGDGRYPAEALRF